MIRIAKLVRACICFYIMEAISAALYPLPRRIRRTRTTARIINFLCAPFFPYAGYWALRKNSNIREHIRKMERDDAA